MKLGAIASIVALLCATTLPATAHPAGPITFIFSGAKMRCTATAHDVYVCKTIKPLKRSVFDGPLLPPSEMTGRNLAIWADLLCGNGCGGVIGGTDVTVTGQTISLPTTLTQNYTLSGTWTHNALVTINNGLTTATANGVANFGAVPSTACQTNGPTATACFGSPCAVVCIDIGKVTGGYGGTTTSNSGKLCFTYNNGADVTDCIYRVQSTNTLVIDDLGTGTIQLGTNTSFNGNNASGVRKVGTNAACTGTTPLTSPATNSFDCRITAASSTAVLTFGSAYAAAPICIVADETTVTSAVKVAVTTTTVTLTPPGAADVLDVACFGNGGV